MPVLIGVLFGRLFMQIAFSRAALTLLLWATVWGTAEDAGSQLVGHGAGRVTGWVAVAILLAWSLWRPARSKAKIWMLEGAYIWLRLGLIVAGVLSFMALLHERGVNAAWARDAWPFLLGGVAAWAAQRWLAALLVRSHHREAEMSKL